VGSQILGENPSFLYVVFLCTPKTMDCLWGKSTN